MKTGNEKVKETLSVSKKLRGGWKCDDAWKSQEQNKGKMDWPETNKLYSNFNISKLKFIIDTNLVLQYYRPIIE